MKGNEMAKPMLKHAVAWLLALMVAFVVAPSMALADDLVMGTSADGFTWTGQHDSSKDEQAWTDEATDEQKAEVALTVYTQYADGDLETKKEFTRAELLNLASENETAVAYEYQNGVYVADSYVTIDQIMGKVGKKGLTITDEDTVKIYTTTGEYTKAQYDNETLKADGKFFPGIKSDGETTDFSDLEDAVDAPAIIALSWANGKWSDYAAQGINAAGIANQLSPYYSDSLRMFSGTVLEAVSGEAPALIAGKNSPSQVNGIAVCTPASNAFTVYCQDGEASEPTAVKEYTRETLETLAASGSKGYLYWGTDVWMAGITTSSVDIVKLIEDAGLKLEANDTLVIAAPDGFKATLSAASIQSEKYFYPAATETGTDASDPDEVGAVLALNWAVVPVTGTAGGTVAGFDSSALTNQYRLFTGVSEENYLAKKAAGNRFVTNPRTLTLIKGEADFSSAKVTLDKAQAAYTGASQQGTVKSVVLDGVELPASAYEVAAEPGVNAGTYKVTVTGKGHYVGSATAEFKITPATQTVVAKNKKAGTLKAKKLKKKAQTIKAAKVTKGDSAKTKLTYKLVKANKSKSKFKVAANGKITVKKKLKKGTYKLTIKASAEKSANYQAASKNFVVTIKVK